jgi:hypothetical protein
VAHQIDSLIAIEISHKQILLIPLAPSVSNPFGRIANAGEPSVFVIQGNMYIASALVTDHVSVAITVDVTCRHQDAVSIPLAKATTVLGCR